MSEREFVRPDREAHSAGTLFATEQGNIIRILKWKSDSVVLVRHYKGGREEAVKDTDFTPTDQDGVAGIKEDTVLELLNEDGSPASETPEELEELDESEEPEKEFPVVEAEPEQSEGVQRALEEISHKKAATKADIIAVYLEDGVTTTIQNVVQDLGEVLYPDGTTKEKMEMGIRQVIGRMLKSERYRIARQGDNIMSLGITPEQEADDSLHLSPRAEEAVAEGEVPEMKTPNGNGIMDVTESEEQDEPEKPVDLKKQDRIIRGIVKDELRGLLKGMMDAL